MESLHQDAERVPSHSSHRVGQEPHGQEPLGQEPVGQEPVGQEPVGQEPVGQEQEPVAPRRWPSVLKLARRIHLYLGMLMLPWVLLFGLTALSFNHPSIWRNLQGRMLPPAQFHELSGFEPWDPDVVADQVVRRLNQEGQSLHLVPRSAAFRGWALFARPGTSGMHVLIVGLDRGAGFLSTRPLPIESAKPGFFGQTITLPGYNSADLARELEPVHGRLGIHEAAPLRPHPEVHPELRFVAMDDQGVGWNVVYDLTTGKLDGRLTSEGHHAALIERFEALHKQHHFPPSFGPTTLWAIFSDLTALTIVLWALTGLMMAWQLRKLRRVVGVTLVLGLGVAAGVMTWTSSDLIFGPERAQAPP